MNSPERRFVQTTDEAKSMILLNNQLDALFSMYLFIFLLYMFRATQCSSSGE
jgi:hypothetical protein